MAVQLQKAEAEDGAWDDMKAGLERSWREFKDAFSNASSKFKYQINHEATSCFITKVH